MNSNKRTINNTLDKLNSPKLIRFDLTRFFWEKLLLKYMMDPMIVSSVSRRNDIFSKEPKFWIPSITIKLYLLIIVNINSKNEIKYIVY